MLVCVSITSLMLVSSFLDEILGPAQSYGSLIVGLDINTGELTAIVQSNLDRSELGIEIAGYPQIRIVVMGHDDQLPEEIAVDLETERRAFGEWIRATVVAINQNEDYVCTAVDPISGDANEP